MPSKKAQSPTARTPWTDPVFSKEFEELVDRFIPGDDEIHSISRQWLKAGGKRIRPMLFIGTYKALAKAEKVPEHVLRLAMAVEVFHKASLVHDDIADGTRTRYGDPTLHMRLTTPASINIGDFLLGCGYTLVAETTRELGGNIAYKVLMLITDAHRDLTLGQGKELRWGIEGSGVIDVPGVEELYMLKTVPGFTVPFDLAHLLVKGRHDNASSKEREAMVGIGIAFQVLNDLSEMESRHGWDDIRNGRPTMLHAIALRDADKGTRETLVRLYMKRPQRTDDEVRTVLEVYDALDIEDAARDYVYGRLEQARRMLTGSREPALAELMRSLIDMLDAMNRHKKE